tara:strand:- start:508 stop:966 length:459 start_codon:yes stop_codon:yes gene_type:complete
MKLNEVLNKPYSYTLKYDDYSVYTSFITDDKVIYDVEFVLESYIQSIQQPSKRDLKNKAFTLNFTSLDKKNKSSQMITNTGDEFRIFATIMAIIKEFIKKFQPSQIWFSALEKSRISLYKKLIKKFAGPLKYKLTSAANSGPDGVLFGLRKM